MAGNLTLLNTPDTLAQAPMPQEDIERKRDMDAAWKAYKGKLADPLNAVKGKPSTDNVKPNRCRPIVDKGGSWLFGPTLKIACTDEMSDETPVAAPTTPPMPGQKPAQKKKQPKKPTPNTDYLTGMWGDDDDKMTLLVKAHNNGGFAGQVFLKLIPATGSMQFPRIVNLNPQLVRIVTLADDCDVHIAYIIEYPGKGNVQKKQIIARVDPDGSLEASGEEDLDDTWTISDYARDTQAAQNDWILVRQDEWPWPFAPIFTCQNLPNPNEAWGTPDLTQDIIDHNKALNFLLSNLQRIIKFHGHPRPYVTGMQAAQLQVAIDDILCLPSEKATMNELKPMEAFDGILKAAASLRDDMDEQSRVPGVALGRLESLPRGNISGVALKILFQPLMEKTTLKQRLYGRLIREISRAGLCLAGRIPKEQYASYKIDLTWQDLLPIDDLLAAQTAMLLKQLGISDATVFGQLGYNSEEEAEKSASEDAAKLARIPKGQAIYPPKPGVGHTPFAGPEQNQQQQQQQGGENQQ